MFLKIPLIILSIITISLSAFSQTVLKDADSCFYQGNYTCAINLYEQAFKLLSGRNKQNAEIRLKDSKICLEKLSIANKAFKEQQYRIAKENYLNIIDINSRDTYAKSQIEKCNEFIIVKVKMPDRINGKLERCLGDKNFETYTLIGSDLGSEATYWKLFEDGKEIRKFAKDTLRLAPLKTTKYRIITEDNLDKFFEFEIIVNKPPLLTGSIEGSGMVCPGEAFSLKINNFDVKENTTLNWYKTDAINKSRKFMGSGIQITDAIYVNSSYEVEANSKGCVSEKKLYKFVNVIPSPELSVSIEPIVKIRSGSRIDLSISGYYSDTTHFEWSVDNFNTILAKQKELKGVKVGKGVNYVYLRAVNGWGYTSNSVKKFVSFKRTNYLFFNFGAVANDFSVFQTGMFTVGIKGLYLRAKFSPEAMFGDINTKTPFTFNALDINDAGRIVNFPGQTGYYYTVTDRVLSDRRAITIGTNIGGKWIRGYLGGGYGSRTMFWNADFISYSQSQDRQNFWIKNSNQTWKGIEAEAGVFIKIGHFNVMGGSSFIFDASRDNPFIDVHLGIGFSTK